MLNSAPNTENVVESVAEDIECRAQQLLMHHGGLEATEFLRILITKEFVDRITLVSSFGSESAVLLHMVSRIDKNLPILFLNTGKLFPETLRYRDQLVQLLGLTDVREIGVKRVEIERKDANGELWSVDPDSCCYFRKVVPLHEALKKFDAWITGRKRYQSASRAHLLRVEAADGKIKVNPIADWGGDDVRKYFSTVGLPPHPLESDGYLSIGCVTCTERVVLGQDARSGRWSGTDKTECGIHTRLETSAQSVPVRAWKKSVASAASEAMVMSQSDVVSVKDGESG